MIITEISATPIIILTQLGLAGEGIVVGVVGVCNSVIVGLGVVSSWANAAEVTGAGSIFVSKILIASSDVMDKNVMCVWSPPPIGIKVR